MPFIFQVLHAFENETWACNQKQQANKPVVIQRVAPKIAQRLFGR